MKQLLSTLFSGNYSFKRFISSPQIHFDGDLIFEEEGTNKRTYIETGLYNLNGKEQQCFQKRFFIFDTNYLNILKNDQSILHEFNFDDKINDIQFPLNLFHMHHCGNDNYSVILRIYCKNSFSFTYDIQGPSKNYKIYTLFERKT